MCSGVVEEHKEHIVKVTADEYDDYGAPSSLSSRGGTGAHATTARDRYNETKVGLMNRIKDVGRHQVCLLFDSLVNFVNAFYLTTSYGVWYLSIVQGHEPHVAFIALVNKMDQSTLPSVPHPTSNTSSAPMTTTATTTTGAMTDASDPFNPPEVDRSDEVTCFLALVHLAR
jgi:hypothetical protein